MIMLPETLPAHQRHQGGLPTILRRFGSLLRDRRYLPYAVSFSLSFAAMFGYIAGSSYVLENVFGISPQLFSVIFAINSGGLIALSLAGSRAVGRRGSAWLLRRGLVVGHRRRLHRRAGGHSIGGGLWPLLVCFLCCCAPTGWSSPTARPWRWPPKRARWARPRRFSASGSSAPVRWWRPWWAWPAATTPCPWPSSSPWPAPRLCSSTSPSRPTLPSACLQRAGVGERSATRTRSLDASRARSTRARLRLRYGPGGWPAT